MTGIPKQSFSSKRLSNICLRHVLLSQSRFLDHFSFGRHSGLAMLSEGQGDSPSVPRRRRITSQLCYGHQPYPRHFPGFSHSKRHHYFIWAWGMLTANVKLFSDRNLILVCLTSNSRKLFEFWQGTHHFSAGISDWGWRAGSVLC